jgi:hypothetical protein
MWASTGRGSPSRNSAWPAYIRSKYAPKHAEIIQDSLNTFAIHDILESATATQITTTAQSTWDLVLIGKLDVPTAVKQIRTAVTPYLRQNMVSETLRGAMLSPDRVARRPLRAPPVGQRSCRGGPSPAGPPPCLAPR